MMPYRAFSHPLYFVRHGETDWNAEGRMQGQQDIPLNAVGLRQAAESGLRLKELIGEDADFPYICSPMIRARQTMELMREAMGLAPQDYRVIDDLRELTFGHWEGLTWKEVRREHPAGARAREADKWRFTPPGGESYETLAIRVGRVMDGIDRPSVMVAHGGVARALLRLSGMSPAKACVADIWQGKLLVFRKDDWAWL